jgi:hypothetical protein
MGHSPSIGIFSLTAKAQQPSSRTPSIVPLLTWWAERGSSNVGAAGGEEGTMLERPEEDEA